VQHRRVGHEGDRGNLKDKGENYDGDQMESIMKCESCIDVDDVARAVRFYGEGIGLPVVKQEQE